MYTIVLGGYLPVRLVGDIAYSNRVASGGASGRQVAKSPVGRQLVASWSPARLLDGHQLGSLCMRAHTRCSVHVHT